MGRRSKDFENVKRDMEASLEDMTKYFDGFRIAEQNSKEEDMLAYAKTTNDRTKQLLGIRHFRRLLCKDNNPHVQDVISLDLVKYFVRALTADDCPILQLEAAWALTNISAGTCEDAKVVMENGALPLLIDFTRNKNVDLKEQALWAIGNIAAEKSFLKTLVEKGALDRVLETLEEDRGDLRLVRIGVWALTNFCRYGSEVVMITSDFIPRIVSTVIALVQHSDRQVMLDAVWAIASFTSAEWSPDTRELLVQQGVLKHLAHTVIYSERPTLQYPALKACAQILSGPESYAVEFLAIDSILKRLKTLLTEKFNRKSTSNILWLIQNIAANKYRVAKSVLNCGIVPRIVELVNYGPYEIKSEAGSVMINLFYIQDLPLSGFDALVAADAISALCTMLTWQTKKTIIDSIVALDKVLNESSKPAAQKWFHLSTADESSWIDSSVKTEKRRVRVRHHHVQSSRYNAIAQRIRLAGGQHTLQLLSDHEDKEIRKEAQNLIQTYFQTDELVVVAIESESDPESDVALESQPNGNGVVSVEEADDEESNLSEGDQDEMALCENVQRFNFAEQYHGTTMQ